jgi:hypothetical protein
MNVIISIQEERIYNDVYAITAHTGKASDNMDKISASEDEAGIIELFLRESASELSDVISTYGTIEYGDGVLNINFDLPSNWKDTAKPTLEQCLVNYLSNSICQRWFAMTNKEDVKYYSDKVVVNATNIIKLLCERIKPKR